MLPGVVLLLLLAFVCWTALLGWAKLPCCCAEARCGVLKSNTCGSMCKQQCVCSRQLETRTTPKCACNQGLTALWVVNLTKTMQHTSRPR
jgi:hypothetical protein